MDTSSNSNAPTLLENGQPVNGEPNPDSQEIQNSQDTHENIASTPPTSDGFEAINHAASLVEDALSTQSQETQLLQLSDVAAAQMPLGVDGNAPSYVVAPSAGQKRTASGMVKSAKSPTSPVTENSAGHTRSVSNISTSSNASSGLKEVKENLFKTSFTSVVAPVKGKPRELQQIICVRSLQYWGPSLFSSRSPFREQCFVNRMLTSYSYLLN